MEKCSPNAIAVTKKVLNSHYNIETSHAAKLFTQCIVHEEGREGRVFGVHLHNWLVANEQHHERYQLKQIPRSIQGFEDDGHGPRQDKRDQTPLIKPQIVVDIDVGDYNQEQPRDGQHPEG